ncbi:MAG: preprotein translocase subunit YajC [Lachnospiraceae bacterium]|nr:preprotein translocase subunit YajC [Lachnospiraceae bacterium]
MSPDMVTSLVMLIVMFGIMYFIAIRPANKQRREQEVMMQNLAKGDSILTTSGFYGVVIDIMEEVVIVEFGNNKNCRIPMKKDAIVEVEKENEAKA